MESWDVLKLLADPTRLRIVRLLRREELSVAELQEILEMGQSRISSHLGLLRSAGLVADRKDGKRSYYSVPDQVPPEVRDLLDAAFRSVAKDPAMRTDDTHLRRILDERRQVAEKYFNAIAGRLGKNYCPGRSWEAIGHFLLFLTPEIDIADLGAGEGTISQLLSKRARQVYCIDSSPRMVEVGTELAKQHDIKNLEYRLGDIEKVPLPDSSVDLALLSQALHHAQRPAHAIEEAARILRPGGRLVILDLNEHTFEKARELYADTWLGFTPNHLYTMLRGAGLQHVEVSVVAREEQEPYFETVLASGVKAPPKD